MEKVSSYGMYKQSRRSNDKYGFIILIIKLFIISVSLNGCSSFNLGPSVVIEDKKLGEGIISDYVGNQWPGISNSNLLPESKVDNENVYNLTPDIVDIKNIKEFEKKYGVDCNVKEFLKCEYKGYVDHTLIFSGNKTRIRRTITIVIMWTDTGKEVSVIGRDVLLNNTGEKNDK